jgi:prolyl-tRNA synthetase
MSKEIGLTVRKGENLSEWYTQVIIKAGLADYSTVKGFMVLMPDGYAIWEKIRVYLDRRLKETGHRNAYFPCLIPESLIRREAEHFAGFNPEVFWVTHAGDTELGERLAIRPTSETIIYDSYSKWVRSWRDLPLLLNTWNSVLRAEIKGTKPFMRTSEFLWQEGHTVHATCEEADKEVMSILSIYKDLIEKELSIPVLAGVKSEREKFVGAFYTATLEAMMPDGKALQMGTSHNLGQNFSKAFGIKFVGQDEQTHFAWNACWGVSWRLIGAMVMVHGDDRGLVLPPRVAPTQVVIVPIFYSDEDKNRVEQKAEDIRVALAKKNVSVHVDLRTQYTPGWKFYEWELKGIPLRIEIGPRDIAAKQVTVVRRDTLERRQILDAQLLEEIEKLLEEIQNNLYRRAKESLENSIVVVNDYESFKRRLEDRGGFLKAPWCGAVGCEDEIKRETGATIRLIPFETEQVSGNCIYCGRKAEKIAYFARAY